MKVNKILTLILIVSLVVFSYSGYKIISLYIICSDDKNMNYLDQVLFSNNDYDNVDEDILSEYQVLYHQNNDMVGHIKIDNTNIDYPVMQSKEQPEYYLKKDFFKNDDSSGTPFVDYRCDVIPNQGFNVIIYGHYSNRNTLFRWLLNYSYEYWYADNKYIKFDTIYNKHIYEVVAAFYADVTNSVLFNKYAPEKEEQYTFYNYLFFDSQVGLDRYNENIKKSQLYETGQEIKKDDHIITIICCAPEQFSHIKENGRFVVIARQVE